MTEIPTERTIRFYTANRLVDKPSERKGTRALYSYRHLLQILAVKYLQSHYLPLVKIRSLMQDASNRELEQLIPEVPPVTAAHRAFIREERRPGMPQPEPAREAPPPPHAAPPDPEEPHACPDAWHRLEVAPGVELHVHAAALSGAQRERLRGALLREMGVLRGWY